MDKLDQNPEWRGSSESVPLNFEDATVWNWCMKDDYQPVDEKTKVWFSRCLLYTSNSCFRPFQIGTSQNLWCHSRCQKTGGSNS